MGSLNKERDALRTSLTQNLRRSAALLEERARAFRMQQEAINAIAKLLGQLEQLQQKKGHRGGVSPWILSTSYRIPNTPLQLIGKYEEGRANLVLDLVPNKGSAIKDVGPASFGVSFDLGL